MDPNLKSIYIVNNMRADKRKQVQYVYDFVEECVVFSSGANKSKS